MNFFCKKKQQKQRLSSDFPMGKWMNFSRLPLQKITQIFFNFELTATVFRVTKLSSSKIFTSFAKNQIGFV